MIQDFYSKLSEKEKKVFYGAVIIVALMFFDMLFLRPILSKLQEEDIEIQSKSNDIKQALRFLSYENKMRQEEKAFQVYHTDESKSEEEIIAGFLKTVELLASESKVNLVKLSPAEVDTKKGYYEYHANLECDGRLEDVLNFMHKIDTTENLLKITKYSMTRQKASAEGVSASMRVAKLIIDPKSIGNYAFTSDEETEAQTQNPDQPQGAGKAGEEQPKEAGTDTDQRNSEEAETEQTRAEPNTGENVDPAEATESENSPSELKPGEPAGAENPEVTRSAETTESMQSTGPDQHAEASQQTKPVGADGAVNRREPGSGGVGPRAIGQGAGSGERVGGPGQGPGGGSAGAPGAGEGASGERGAGEAGESGNPSSDNRETAGGQQSGAEAGGQADQVPAGQSSNESGGGQQDQQSQAGEGQGQPNTPGEGQGAAESAGDQAQGEQGSSGQGQSAAGQPGTGSAGGATSADRQSGIGSGGGAGGAGQGGASGAGGESGGGEPAEAGRGGGYSTDRGLPSSGGDSGSGDDDKREKPSPKKVKKEPNKLQNKLDDVNKGKRFRVEDFGTLWNNFWGIKPKAGSQKPEAPSLQDREGEDEGIEDKPNLWERMIKSK